jgi:hypothetical protein
MLHGLRIQGDALPSSKGPRCTSVGPAGDHGDQIGVGDLHALSGISPHCLGPRRFAFAMAADPPRPASVPPSWWDAESRSQVMRSLLRCGFWPAGAPHHETHVTVAAMSFAACTSAGWRLLMLGVGCAVDTAGTVAFLSCW